MTILDQPGAENLLGRGDMLFLAGVTVERLQGFYVSPDELACFLSAHRGGDFCPLFYRVESLRRCA